MKKPWQGCECCTAGPGQCKSSAVLAGGEARRIPVCGATREHQMRELADECARRAAGYDGTAWNRDAFLEIEALIREKLEGK